MDARASRLLMSTRADKWALSYMPHWLRTLKIPGLSFRNLQTWTKVATSFSSWGETARLSFKQHNKVTGRPTICPQFFSHGFSRQKEGADKGSDWKDETWREAHWLGYYCPLLNPTRPAVNGRTFSCCTFIPFPSESELHRWSDAALIKNTYFREGKHGTTCFSY